MIDGMPDNDRSGALLLLDLDNFKSVNDLYGHAAGDRLLCILAQALRGAVPATAICARIGGDEFAVFLPGRAGASSAELVAERILGSLGNPIILAETEILISASIGIALLDEICSTADALFQRADIAMYEAKRAGKNRFVWFAWQMEDDLHRRHQLEAEIRIGITRDEFVPFFQPLIDLSNGALTGFEVLARWNHPERGLLEPCDFIHTAESSALISSLSLAVMRDGLQQAKDWPAHLKIAVNVSPVQFKDPALAQKIMHVLAEVGFPAGRLEIEVTENSMMEDREQATATVTSLKNLGVTISLDDFGTGYASLAQLKALPFDRIKIDRSLVSPLLDDEKSDAIVATITNLGQTLRLPVTAEGVETAAVRARLESIGCTDAQGWLFGRAMPGDTIAALLKAHGGKDATGLGGVEAQPPSSQEAQSSSPEVGPRRRTA
jgi:diguanylate cyclase (GGDEF)-like protein